MKLVVYILLVLSVGLTARAGTVGGDETGALAASPLNTDFDIGIYPDTQNQPNPGVVGSDGVTPRETDCSTFYECVGEYCDKTIECEGSWLTEGAKTLRRQVDFEAGLDPKYPYKSVLSVHVGDIADSYDVSSTADKNIPCNANQVSEWDTIDANLIQYAEARGVPTIFASGNHDCLAKVESSVVARAQLQPYFVSTAVDAGVGHEDVSTLYSVKVATRVGEICAVSVPYQFYAETRDAAASLLGCGASLPTIIVKHDGVNSVGGGPSASSLFWSTTPAANDLVNSPTAPFTWMLVGGHWTSGGYSGTWKTTMSDNGEELITNYGNFQELKHRNWGGASPYGVTPPNGADGQMRRCRVSPSRSLLHCFDWSPVYNTKDARYGVPTTEAVIQFDWCARFGGC